VGRFVDFYNDAAAPTTTTIPGRLPLACIHLYQSVQSSFCVWIIALTAAVVATEFFAREVASQSFGSGFFMGLTQSSVPFNPSPFFSRRPAHDQTALIHRNPHGPRTGKLSCRVATWTRAIRCNGYQAAGQQLQTQEHAITSYRSRIEVIPPWWLLRRSSPIPPIRSGSCSRCQPDEIYNLGAQSHVAVRLREPEYTPTGDPSAPCAFLRRCAFLGLTSKNTDLNQAQHQPSSWPWCRNPPRRSNHPPSYPSP